MLRDTGWKMSLSRSSFFLLSSLREHSTGSGSPLICIMRSFFCRMWHTLSSPFVRFAILAAHVCPNILSFVFMTIVLGCMGRVYLNYPCCYPRMPKRNQISLRFLQPRVERGEDFCYIIPNPVLPAGLILICKVFPVEARSAYVQS